MWEHFDDLPFEVFCTDNKGERHLISRHRLESEAAHSMNAQNRSGGYAAEYCDWRQTAPKVDPKDFHAHLDQCAQCRNHPMALCSVGANLLKGAVVLSQPHGVIEQP